MRSLDDLVDKHQPEARERVDAVESWTHDGQASTPETRTLAELSRRHALPMHSLREFCNGMRHDLEHARIDTEADLELYCQRVAGTVATMLARLLGVTHPHGETKMALLGRAMQRTNILRDIDEDAANGRLYIARRTVEHFGAPEPGAREELLRDQIARADTLYDEGIDAIPLLRQGQHGIVLCVALYRQILRQIEREGYGRERGRITVPPWRTRLLSAKHLLPGPHRGPARARRDPCEKHRSYTSND
jgi:phytoene synthase